MHTEMRFAAILKAISYTKKRTQVGEKKTRELSGNTRFVRKYPPLLVTCPDVAA
jgi:hypothetical protein